MMKRVMDVLVSSSVLILFSPILLVSIALVFLEDFKNPIYSASRVGLYGNNFKMNPEPVR